PAQPRRLAAGEDAEGDGVLRGGGEACGHGEWSCRREDWTGYAFGLTRRLRPHIPCGSVFRRELLVHQGTRRKARGRSRYHMALFRMPRQGCAEARAGTSLPALGVADQALLLRHLALAQDVLP